MDDRPIKPDQKYVAQFLERINKVEVKPYLKKNKEAVLPCNQQIQSGGRKENHPSQSKTKAQIYQIIKQKNIARFGEKKMGEVQIQEKKKTIHPKRMTVNYKPKIFIEKKQPKAVEGVDFIRPVAKSVDKQKIEYEKLLDYFKGEVNNLEREKQQFAKVADKLKFKQMIGGQDELLFSKIKNEVEQNLILQKFAKKKNTNNEREGKRQDIKQDSKDRKPIAKTCSVKQIKDRMEKTSRELQQLRARMTHSNLEFKEHRYDISQIHVLPNFDPQTIYDFIDGSKLRFDGNDNYKAALDEFYARCGRSKPKGGNMCEEEVSNGEMTGVLKKMVGQKRVLKYGGWVQVWIPGQQRLMARDGYKVVWLKNGDVVQEFRNQIKSYYSREKEVYKIDYGKHVPIYYHEGLKQIWRQVEGEKEVVLANGRRETVEVKLYINY